MSLPISKLMNLSTPSAEELKMSKDDKKKLDNNAPMRQTNVKGIKQMSNKNHKYAPNDFDQFNVAMKQDMRDKGMQDLHMAYASAIPQNKQYSFANTEGWIDPAQRRRLTDPNHAPPYDYINGSAFQRFTNDADETTSHNNVDLIRKAHQSYQNYVNRYSMAPGSPNNPGMVNFQNPYMLPSQGMPNMTPAIKPSI